MHKPLADKITCHVRYKVWMNPHMITTIYNTDQEQMWQMLNAIYDHMV